MIPIPVGRVGADRAPRIDRIARHPGRDESAQHRKAARVGAQIDALGGAAGRRHAIDRAAERARPEAQRIGATIDFEMVEEDRFEFLEIAIVVGEVDRHPVLEQRDAAHVETARQARTADRQAHFLPIARLEIDSGRKGQRVAQADDRFVGIIFIGNDIGAAGRFGGARFGRIGKLRRGDDDRRLILGVRGMGGGRQGNGERQQWRRTGHVTLHGKSFA